MSVRWQDMMWAELDHLEPLAQVVACGEWITEMQQTLVPALSQRRREKILEEADRNGRDYYLIAESIGSRKATVERLANEGRAQRRDHQAHPDAA